MLDASVQLARCGAHAPGVVLPAHRPEQKRPGRVRSRILTRGIVESTI